MDLSGNQKLKTLWEHDEDLDLLTVTFKDDTETTTFGTLVIEGTRFRSLVDMLNNVGQFFLPPVLDLTTRQKHRTVLENGTASTEFNA